MFPNEQSSQKKDRNENKIDAARKVSVLDVDSTTSTAVSSSEEQISKPASPKPKEHTRIIFDLNEQPKKKSVLERLGKRHTSVDNGDNIDFKSGEKRSKPNTCDDKNTKNTSKRKIFTDKQNTSSQSKSGESKKKYDWNKNERSDAVEMEKREVTKLLIIFF